MFATKSFDEDAKHSVNESSTNPPAMPPTNRSVSYVEAFGKSDGQWENLIEV